jgi:hypothetical protein
MNGAGFPHSEIFGSKRACRSPKLIAACCVLRRLMKPRHPSIAVTGLCKRSHILGVYLTHLHNYPKLSKNEIRPTTSPSHFITQPKDSRLARMVGPDGLEPSTPRLSSACSNQLSYEPKTGNGLYPGASALVEPTRFELVTPCLQSRCSTN